MGKIYYCGKGIYKNVTSLNLMRVEEIEFDKRKIKKNTLVLITSKIAFNILKKSFPKTYRDFKYIVFGDKIIELLKQNGCTIEYSRKVQNSQDLINKVQEDLKGKKIFYVKAEDTVGDVKGLESIEIEELIVYKTLPQAPILYKIEDNANIIFASPKQYQFFLKYYNWNESYKAICIGYTTYANLPNTIDKYMSEELSIESCIQLAKEI